MTREQAERIKGIIKHEPVTTYYNGKKQELRVRVFKITDGGKELIPDWQKREASRTCKVLTRIQETTRPKFRIERKRYQGFINCTYIVFE